MVSTARRHGPPGEAEDIVEDACLRLLRYASRLRELEPRQQAVYLYKLVQHTACNHYNMQYRRRDVHEVEGVTEQGTEGLEKEIERRDVLHLVLERLPPRDHDLLTLHYLWGYSVKETARIMGLPPASTGVYLQRARARAKKLLQREEGNDYAL